MPDYVIRPLRLDEVQTAVEWAAGEGWNPGAADAGCFMTVDSEGFWGGFLDDKLIASISVVNYDEAFAFLGFYIVRPEHRGQGYGLRLWQRAVQHGAGRNIGLDGVVDQQQNYRKSGFELAYRNIRHGGRIDHALTALDLGTTEAIQQASDASDALLALDSSLFPAPRTAFVRAWLDAPGHVSYAAIRRDKPVGYATVRPCRTGYKIGPLFAPDIATAKALTHAALSAVPDENRNSDVFLDTPEPNSQAVALASSLGLDPVFETARMYTGPAPELDLSRIFGVTTFELG